MRVSEKDTATGQFSPERFTAFIDAVVAIAMTLLILPLMEAVSDASSGDLDTAGFLSEHGGQIMSFALSFVLIANAWIAHHRQYNRVTVITRRLLWINVAWMATIVWLPVATAMLGQMETDPLQAVIYIGTLIVMQFTTLAGRIHLLRNPVFTRSEPAMIRRGAAADLASAILFGVALTAVILLGSYGYYALFALILTSPLARLIRRLSGTARFELGGDDDAHDKHSGAPQ